jgi:hypothetical protein
MRVPPDPDLPRELVGELAGAIGPRRPTGPAERRAAEYVGRWLAERGMSPRYEEFTGLATFAGPQAVAPALGLIAGLGSSRRSARALGLLALIAGVGESDPRAQVLTRIMARSPSQNLVAAVEPRGKQRRTLCLVSHLDSSRSGLLFHPWLAPRLRPVIDALSGAVAVRSAIAVLGLSSRPARLASSAAGGLAALGLALLAERELRGVDVPGANDNASGVAVAAALAAEVAGRPLESTRLVFLATGCEESGTIGMRSFLERHDTSGWLFLNLDGVAAPATLRWLPREGVGRTWPADPGLVAVAERVAGEHPELGLAPAVRLVGLTYDATQVLARGGRALTLSAQDDTIPNYHTPADVPANVSDAVLARALAATRLVIEAIDRGDADWS